MGSALTWRSMPGTTAWRLTTSGLPGGAQECRTLGGQRQGVRVRLRLHQPANSPVYADLTVFLLS